LSDDSGGRVSDRIPPLADLHNHFVPGVDDGARTVEEAIAALKELYESGVTRVATTPHLSSRRASGPRKVEIQASFEELRRVAERAIPDLSLSLAYEVRLDEADVELGDRSLGLSDRHLLVEFSMLMVPAYPMETLNTAVQQDWVPVLAHPERYAGIEARYGLIQTWRDAGVVMCVNAASVWGRYGREAEWAVRRMLADGAVDLIASDHHARPGRSATMRQVWDLLLETGHDEAARLLLSENPAAILDGGDPLPVPPVHLSEGWTERLKRMVGRSQ
jgi:tyrosine-protein phosphatase YwqE